MSDYKSPRDLSPEDLERVGVSYRKERDKLQKELDVARKGYEDHFAKWNKQATDDAWTIANLKGELDSWKASASENHAKFCQARQELDAARAEVQKWENSFTSGVKDLRHNYERQLADAKTQIADYEAALEYYKSTWDFGIKARETLNKWKAK